MFIRKMIDHKSAVSVASMVACCKCGTWKSFPRSWHIDGKSKKPCVACDPKSSN